MRPPVPPFSLKSLLLVGLFAIGLLTQDVAALAEQPDHWAYRGASRPPLPQVSRTAWPINGVDLFVLTRLDEQQLRPSPPAERAVLARRVYLDLTGLPPTVEQVDAFLADRRPDAYERLVDHLLSSPRYGERWARPWLDLARYADSNGYQADQYRSVWPYRDWVIGALNQDMPFDQFTIEQLAGDLLPEASVDQRIATGFHRLTTCNVEAGVDPEENRVEQIIDRVNTTGTVWLGTTIECAQCHDHKYDPFTQREYYQLLAYFNNTPLEVEGNGVTYNFVGPDMSLPVPPQQEVQLRELQEQLAQLKQSLARDSETAAAEEEAASQQPKDATPKALRQQITALQEEIGRLQPTTLVMVELDQLRQTSVMRRGNFLDPGEPVEPGTPAALHGLPDDARPDRLGLARWLVDPHNPLVARVAVNRWWAEMFGRGLVASLEDFGTQGEPPTHPALLDWLAVELMDSGWSMKHVHRLIVTSATYRQSSRVTPELRAADPYNVWYARGPRVRLSAEAIRDQALAASGLLSATMGGQPVYPPQPPNVWRHVGRNPPKYETSTGDDRYRRGIYVIWRRSAPYPSFVNFDAPDRAACVISRPRTNTPLQALTLLNDPAYVEMAWALAEQAAAQDTQAPLPDRMCYALRRCIARHPKPEEVDHLVHVYQREHQRLEQEEATMEQLLADRSLPAGVEAADLAAWFYVSNILLNLDETITKN